MDFFFTFLDRSLAYDCPSCGQACCRRGGLVLDARKELVQFARLEPRLSALMRPLDEKRTAVIEAADGCWMLAPDGACGIYQHRPSTCRLFPFNAIARAGGVRIVDFHNRICPLQDAAGARTGVSWAELTEEIDRAGDAATVWAETRLPEGAEKLRWREVESRHRDAIAGHLADDDYAIFAAAQGAEDAGILRALAARWRALFGIDATHARAAARQMALLTCSLRMNLLQRHGVAPYAVELRRMPRHLLATSVLVELGMAARKTPPGLRTAVETFQGAAPLCALLALWDRPARLHGEIPPLNAPAEVRDALAGIGRLLRQQRELGSAVEEALAAAPAHVRGLALSTLASAPAPLEIG